MSSSVVAGNLPWETTEADLAAVFSGNTGVEIQRNQYTNRSKGWAVIIFPTAEQATDAVSRHNQTEFNGRRMVVRPQRVPAPSGAAGVFFGGLPWSFTDAELASLVAPYNPVSTPAVAMTLTGRSRGFAIVYFANAEAAQRAINELNGATVGDRQISARPDEGRDGAPAQRGEKRTRQTRRRRNPEEAAAAAPAAEATQEGGEAAPRRRRNAPRRRRGAAAAGTEGEAAPAATEATPTAEAGERQPRRPRQPRVRREPEAEGSPSASLFIGNLDKRSTDEAALAAHLASIVGEGKIVKVEVQKVERGGRAGSSKGYAIVDVADAATAEQIKSSAAGTSVTGTTRALSVKFNNRVAATA